MLLEVRIATTARPNPCVRIVSANDLPDEKARSPELGKGNGPLVRRRVFFCGAAPLCGARAQAPGPELLARLGIVPVGKEKGPAADGNGPFHMLAGVPEVNPLPCGCYMHEA